MNRIKIYLFWLFIATVWSSCYKGNELIIVDHPPVLEPDTTVVSYYGNITIGTIKLPADTIYTTMQADSANPGVNIGYTLDSYVDQLPTFSLFWESLSPFEEKITEGVYTGCCSVLMTDSSLARLQDWILRGRDMNQPPLLDSIPFNYYMADHVDITVTNVVEAVQIDTLAPGMLWIVDRATIQLNGIMINIENGAPKALSGSFTCHFGRMGM